MATSTSKTSAKTAKAPAKTATKAAPKKTPAAKAKTPAKAAAKPVKTAAPKAAAAKPQAAKPAAKPAAKAKRAPVADDQRRYYIEVAAYYIAERHGFSGGRELADWEQASKEIDQLLADGRLNP